MIKIIRNDAHSSKVTIFVQVFCSSWYVQMTSAERVFEYAQIKPEPDNGCNHALEPTWPNSGSITADSASFSYHSSLKNALDNLNFTVGSKEKVSCRLKLVCFVHI